jgi:hypothetical protein
MMRKKGGALRHFEGWEVGAIAVVIALAGTLLAVPLQVAPEDVPAPVVDGRLLSATIAREKSLAAAMANELANAQVTSELYDLRAFGEEFRAYGAAETSGDTYAVVRVRQRLVEAVSRARAAGEEKLLGLRAYQKTRFLEELRRWEDGGSDSAELVGLGGGFLDLAQQSGWRRGRTIAMDDDIRGVLFKRRWNQITGLGSGAYTISLDEHRALYGFLLTHPYVEGRGALAAREACIAADRWRLRKVEELARLDASYPYALARGVLFYRLGRFPEAVQAFRDHLGNDSEGRYFLRARNYLMAATARAVQEP